MDCIILAGGRGTRLVPDKGMLPFGSSLLLDYIITRHARLFSRIFLVITDEEPYRRFGVPLIRDRFPGAGPMGGVLSGLKEHGGRAFFCACDMPFIREELIRTMGAGPFDYDALVPRFRGFYEPLCAVYTQACVKAMEERIRERRYKLSAFFDHGGVQYLHVDYTDTQGQSFFNINTPADYMQALLIREREDSRGDTLPRRARSRIGLCEGTAVTAC